MDRTTPRDRAPGTNALSPLELAANRVLGYDDAAPPLPTVGRDLTPVAALEQAVLPALARPPCVVTFSGGRDSSLVLAVATAVARREGLEPPIAVTARFGSDPQADEGHWQELVIDHLGVDDWMRTDVVDRVDLVGETVGAVLRRHGVLYPLNAYVHLAAMGQARGGSVLTGVHGDAVLGGGRWRALHDLRRRRARPRRDDLPSIALALAPSYVRARYLRRRSRRLPWLRPDAQERFIAAKVRRDAAQPRRYDHGLAAYLRRRSVAVAAATMDLLASDHDAVCVHPLGSPRFVAAMAVAGGATGVGDRTATMRTHFAGLLPDRLLAREGKAVFAASFVGEATDAFTRDWDGSGVETDLVDPAVLAEVWQHRPLDLRSALLLQQAWLHRDRRDRGVRASGPDSPRPTGTR